jgi:hypothetical protein
VSVNHLSVGWPIPTRKTCSNGHRSYQEDRSSQEEHIGTPAIQVTARTLRNVDINIDPIPQLDGQKAPDPLATQKKGLSIA